MAANVKITANSSDFQRQMKEMSRELKKVSSSYNLANTQAKLFGKTSDVLKIRQEELSSKIRIQNNMIEAQSKHIKNLNHDLKQQKDEQSKLNNKIEEANKRYKESVSQTGKNSEESKKLQKELKDLKEEYAKNNKEIDRNINKLDNAEIKLNKSKTALLKNQKALQDVNEELKKSNITKFTKGLEEASNKADDISNKMRPASTTILGLGIAAATAGMNFEDGMAKVSTIADTTQVPLEDLKKGILDLSDQTGISSSEIANNVYDAISAGQETGDAVNFVNNSTKLAKAGFAEAGQSLDLLTTILNSYGLEAKEVTNVSDTLIQTQNLGKVTVGELSSDMGKVIPTAKSVGVNLTQVATGYAIMTSKGIKSAETTTYMNSMLNELGKSGTTANKALTKASGKSLPELIKSGKSLGDILAIMDKHAKSNGKSLSDMFGSAEAGKAALVLSSQSGEEFNDMLGKMKGSAGATEKAFKKVNSTSGQDFKKSLNLAKNALIEFGDVLSPVISLGAKAISSISKGIGSLSKGQKTFIVELGATFVTLNLVIGGFSKLASGISSTIKVISNLPKNIKKGIKSIKDFGSSCKKTIKSVKDFSTKIGKIRWNKVTKGANLAKNGVSSFGTACKKGIKGIQSFGKSILNITKTLAKLSLTIFKNTATLFKNSLAWTINKTKLLAHKAVQLTVTKATKAMTLAQKALNLAMKMNPIGVVITVLIALGAVFVTLYSKCEWFRNGVNAVWKKVKSIFVGFANFLKGAFKTDFTQTLGFFGAPLNSFFDVVKSTFDGIKGIFNGLMKFLQGVFTGNWKQVFRGLKDIVASIFGAIGGVIKAPINAAIRGINSAIRGVNRISFTVPNWVPGIGGSHFGVHLPQIPALAEGGIVTKATMALVGEGKEHEAVIPLSKLDKLVTSSVEKVLNNNKSNSNSKQTFIVKNILDSKEISSQTYEFTNNQFALSSKRRRF